MSRDKLFLGSILGAFLGLNLITFLIEVPSIFRKPYDLLLDEGGLWYLTTLVSRGESLYQEVSSAQMVITPQTPIQMLLTGWIAAFTGNPLLVGRVLSLICGLLVCGLVFFIVKKLTRNPWIGLVSALLVISLPVFRLLSVVSRMDTMGLVFSLAGILIVLQFERRGKLLYWSIPLFLLAFFTKQVFILAPIAVCILFLVRDRNWKRSLKFGSLYIAFLGVGLLVGNFLTGGQLLLHTFIYHFRSAPAFSWKLDTLVTEHLILWVALVAYFIYRLVKRHPLSLIEIYFLVTLPVVIYLIGKPGSAFHYGLEPLVLGCILIGVVLSDASRYFKEKLPSMEGFAPLGCIIVLVVIQSLGIPFGKGYTMPKYLDETGESYYGMANYIKEAEGPVLGQHNSSPSLGGNGVEVIRYSPGIWSWGNPDDGLWDQSVLIPRLETGYYNLVLLDFDLELAQSEQAEVLRLRLTPKMEEAISSNYSLDFKSGWLGTSLYPYQTYIYKYSGVDLE